MRAYKEIGFRKTARFIFWTFFKILFTLAIFPPLRLCLLRLFGAKIGKETIIHQIKMINLYAKGLSNLEIGDQCFFGEGVTLDLANKIVLEDQVTLSPQVLIITHTNVGYQNHPLQKKFPRFDGAVFIKSGSFIGARAIILPGVEIGPEAFVAAGAVVVKKVFKKTLVAGNPSKRLRKI